MISLFGRGFDSLQLHKLKSKAAEKQRLYFLCIMKRSLFKKRFIESVAF